MLAVANKDQTALPLVWGDVAALTPFHVARIDPQITD
jgi:hypothetical protein